MLIELVGHTLHSDNDDTLAQIMVVLGISLKSLLLSKGKLIQPVLIQLLDHTLHSHNFCTLSSDKGGTGHLSKVTNCKRYSLNLF